MRTNISITDDNATLDVDHGNSLIIKSNRYNKDSNVTDDNCIYVYQDNVDSTLGSIDSSKTYCIDSLVDLGSLEIVVPTGGVNIVGMSSDAKLISSLDDYTMFKSDQDGSGSINIKGLGFELTGTNVSLFNVHASDVYDDFLVERCIFNLLGYGAAYNYDKIVESKNTFNLNNSVYNNIRFVASDGFYPRYSDTTDVKIIEQ